MSGVCTMNRRIAILGEYGTYGQFRAFKGTYNQVWVNESKWDKYG